MKHWHPITIVCYASIAAMIVSCGLYHDARKIAASTQDTVQDVRTTAIETRNTLKEVKALVVEIKTNTLFEVKLTLQNLRGNADTVTERVKVVTKVVETYKMPKEAWAAIIGLISALAFVVKRYGFKERTIQQDLKRKPKPTGGSYTL